jgi:hypothetical protein
MKRLSKDQKQQRADLVTRLNDAAEAVRAALAAVNAEIAGKLNSAIENYNLVVSVVEAFRDEIVSEMEHYASDRSDRWQKSERYGPSPRPEGGDSAERSRLAVSLWLNPTSVRAAGTTTGQTKREGKVFGRPSLPSSCG